MTPVQTALAGQLTSLASLISALNYQSYCYASNWLSNASIGQHCRHIIELVQCLQQGYYGGIVNYDARNRDRQIETDCGHAVTNIQSLIAGIEKEDKPLILCGSFNHYDLVTTEISTTYNREIVYNIEHAVHHMALIKVALKELNFELIDETFGVAYATIQYRKACAQ